MKQKLLSLASKLQEIAEELTDLAEELESEKPKKKAKTKKKTTTKKKKTTSAPVTPNYEAANDFFRSYNRVAKMMKRGRVTDDDEDDDMDVDFEEIEEKPEPKKRRTPQERFEDKMKRGAYDEFNSQDLVCFFRYCAERKGIRYVSHWSRDASVMKKLMEEFSVEEIIMMTEFLFFSDQDYLDKKRLTVGIFSTGWLSRIYQDADDWVNDRYVPDSQKKKQAPAVQREWKGDKDEDVAVGGLE